MDEPEAALSTQRQLSLFSRIAEMATKEGSQYIIVTHSPILLGSQGSGEIKMSREHQSPHYTTLWSDIPKTSVR